MTRKTFGDELYNSLSEEKKENFENTLYASCLEYMKKSDCSSSSINNKSNVEDCYAPWKECEEYIDNIFLKTVIDNDIFNAKTKNDIK